MVHSLTWLPAVLKNAGLKVAEVDGWESRGRGEIGSVVGVMCHHTVGSRNGNMPSLNTLVNGRSDLAGPLSQLGLGRDGTFFVIAAGRCNHSGRGFWKGVSDGNAHFIGIEAENTGRADDLPWPEVQMDAYRRGSAALLRHVGSGVEFCVGHKEYAQPQGRKDDPDFDMDQFRTSVATILDGTAPLPILIPAFEPAPQPGAPPGRPTLRRGAVGEGVKQIQTTAGVAVVDGFFGPRTEAAVRVFQRAHGLVPDGIVGPKTWAALDAEV
jgi:peptidoglycan hydrolase-like protein with peptidoglycan-binding domain